MTEIIEESLPGNLVADLFRRMAKRIEHNTADGFGGAFLIVPPEGGGDPIETLILDATQDASQYWILLKAKCDAQLAKLDNAQRQATFRR